MNKLTNDQKSVLLRIGILFYIFVSMLLLFSFGPKSVVVLIFLTIFGFFAFVFGFFVYQTVEDFRKYFLDK